MAIPVDQCCQNGKWSVGKRKKSSKKSDWKGVEKTKRRNHCHSPLLNFLPLFIHSFIFVFTRKTIFNGWSPILACLQPLHSVRLNPIKWNPMRALQPRQTVHRALRPQPPHPPPEPFNNNSHSHKWWFRQHRLAKEEFSAHQMDIKEQIGHFLGPQDLVQKARMGLNHSQRMFKFARIVASVVPPNSTIIRIWTLTQPINAQCALISPGRRADSKNTSNNRIHMNKGWPPVFALHRHHRLQQCHLLAKTNNRIHRQKLLMNSHRIMGRIWLEVGVAAKLLQQFQPQLPHCLIGGCVGGWGQKIITKK